MFLVDWFVLFGFGHKRILVSQANFALPFEVLSQFIKYGASSKKTEGERCEPALLGVACVYQESHPSLSQFKKFGDCNFKIQIYLEIDYT